MESELRSILLFAHWIYPKTGSNFWVRCSRSVILLTWLLFLVALPQHALAQKLDWSFEEHPQPISFDLVGEEFRLLTRGTADTGSHDYCRIILANAFEIYERRHPDFLKTGEIDRRYREWKAYMARKNDIYLGFCLYEIPTMELYRTSFRIDMDGLQFCGARITSSGTPAERYFQYFTDQLLDNAEAGQVDALDSLLASNELRDLISLNPDIEYFLRRSLFVAGEGKPEDWDVSQMLPELDAERIAFLDDAIARKDFAAVVATTPACPVQ